MHHEIVIVSLVICQAIGQFYTTGGCYPDNPTCDNPDPPVLCDTSRCVCPLRQVISEDGRQCIDRSLCSESNNVWHITIMSMKF